MALLKTSQTAGLSADTLSLCPPLRFILASQPAGWRTTPSLPPSVFHVTPAHLLMEALHTYSSLASASQRNPGRHSLPSPSRFGACPESPLGP